MQPGTFLYIIVVIVPSVVLVSYTLYHYAWIIYISRNFQKIAARYGLNYSPPGLLFYPTVVGRVGSTGVNVSIVKRRGFRRIKVDVFRGKGIDTRYVRPKDISRLHKVELLA